jgi:cytochrome c oxidase accessory protein FixG
MPGHAAFGRPRVQILPLSSNMALTIEIDHARERAKRTGAAGMAAKVVPQSVKGRIRRLKWAVLVLTLGIYSVAPFLRWDRGPGEPSQAILLDFEHGRLYAFFVEIWPQELYYITGLMILAAAALILANALAGRVWCGFACPQTVWTDLFLLVERLIEGDRRDRLRKAVAPWTLRRVAEVAAKHALWLAISFATAATLVGYFTDAPTLFRDIVHAEASLTVWVWIAIFAGMTYGLAGLAREQVCTFMCPWPRLQGAIWDPEALTVNYRDYRGEPRTSAKKAAELRRRGEQAGDCVACDLCVSVCPIGIDIREGPNFACINCGLCVDACDDVMASLARPRGLIDYESWNNIERGRRAEARVLRLVRPKTVLLTASCVANGGGHDDHVREPDQRIDIGAARPRPGLRRTVRRLRPQRLHHQASQQVGRAARVRAQSRGARRHHGNCGRRARQGGDRAGRWFGGAPRHADDGPSAERRRPIRGQGHRRQGSAVGG